MSATLYREGDDLDEVLAELDQQHAGNVRVVSVSYPREGGVFGFFARRRVAVHYTLGAAAADDEVPQRDDDGAPLVSWSDGTAAAGPLAELIDAVEACEQRPAVRRQQSAATGRPRAEAARQTGSAESDELEHNAEFARMLLELAARKSATTARAHLAAPSPATEPVPAHFGEPAERAARCAEPTEQAAPVVEPAESTLRWRAGPIAEPQPIQWPTATAAPTQSAELTIRRQLVELGVPIGWIPAGGGVRRTLEAVVGRLPAATPPPAGPGAILAIAGPPAAARRAAELVRAALHLDADRVWVAGSVAGADTGLIDPWTASAVAACHRLAGGLPAVVVVPTEEADGTGHGDWTTQLLAALAPDAIWAVVDATRKPGDTQALLRALPNPSALVVDQAARTCSPASVWSAGIAIALLDGEPATGARWVELLERRLAAMER